MLRWHKQDLLNRMYVPIKEGKKIAMPRYYKDKIYTQLQRDVINAHIAKEMLIEAQKATDADDTRKEYIRIKKFKTKQRHERLNEKL